MLLKAGVYPANPLVLLRQSDLGRRLLGTAERGLQLLKGAPTRLPALLLLALLLALTMLLLVEGALRGGAGKANQEVR
jgi:hypothetical protein